MFGISAILRGISIVILGAAVVPEAWIGRASNPTSSVNVRHADGSLYSGQIDDRTDQASLWLRFVDGSTAVVRSFRWERITSIHVDEVSTERRIPATGGSNFPDEIAAVTPANQAAPAEVDFSAFLADWDEDGKADGLIVRVSPLDDRGNPIEAKGLVTVSLSEYVPEVEQGHESTERRLLDRWIRRIDRPLANHLAYELQLPLHPATDRLLRNGTAAPLKVKMRFESTLNTAFEFEQVPPMLRLVSK